MELRHEPSSEPLLSGSSQTGEEMALQLRPSCRGTGCRDGHWLGLWGPEPSWVGRGDRKPQGVLEDGWVYKGGTDAPPTEAGTEALRPHGHARTLAPLFKLLNSGFLVCKLGIVPPPSLAGSLNKGYLKGEIR